MHYREIILEEIDDLFYCYFDIDIWYILIYFIYLWLSKIIYDGKLLRSFIKLCLSEFQKHIKEKKQVLLNVLTFTY